MSIVVEVYEELTKEEYKQALKKFIEEDPENLEQGRLNSIIHHLRRIKTTKRLQEISQKIYEKWKFPQTYFADKLMFTVDTGSMEKAGEVKEWLEKNFGPFRKLYLSLSVPEQDQQRFTYAT